ncbi:c6 zinc finger domain containing protein [Grosmannia clavigera kw1407]|uniref:C6 zinc finger domain containing protein n=1 Tax=Grosmannia clavigera (strain kw1407 / UAMH 11150) TaxID=655863 RepID=F0XST4_GROCL|nr:c6 zinc finger domain containing protein [Grosmannia clavigera kw1407]EFW99223.1 c6 zinc finger domain containing protein [Grosmannia clavigera kw1407]
MGSTAPPAAASISCMPIPQRTMTCSAPTKRNFRVLLRPLNIIVLSLILAVLLPVAAANTADPIPLASNSNFKPTATLSPGTTETFIRDNRVPVKQNGRWVYLSDGKVDDLRRRVDTATDSSTSAKTTTTKTTSKKTTSTSTASSSALPEFFDSSLASNYSSSGNCPTFIKSFISNSTFTKCYPFSLLLEGSTSFFNAEKSLVSITQVLDASCAANVTFCANYLDNLATDLISSDNCGDDYNLGNSVVHEAYLGMQSYQVLYSATCLKDSASSQYCFANAITNLTTTANAYFYYLPLNISLPGSSMPSCNTCLKNTMAVFRAASIDRNQPIANTLWG